MNTFLTRNIALAIALLFVTIPSWAQVKNPFAAGSQLTIINKTSQQQQLIQMSPSTLQEKKFALINLNSTVRIPFNNIEFSAGTEPGTVDADLFTEAEESFSITIRYAPTTNMLTLIAQGKFIKRTESTFEIDSSQPFEAQLTAVEQPNQSTWKITQVGRYLSPEEQARIIPGYPEARVVPGLTPAQSEFEKLLQYKRSR